MTQKYKIGTISKMLGIPSQTLHYYEKCGFVTPEKDTQSGYRYYDAWDINFLLDSKYWQSYEFSNNTVEQMINCSDISDIKEKLSLQRNELIDKLVFYQNLIEQLGEEELRLSRLNDHLNQYTLMPNPILYYDTYRKQYTYQSALNPEKPPEMKDWIKAFPFVQPTFFVDKESITLGTSPENYENLLYWWGFSVTPQKAKELDLQFCNKASFLPSKKCIYTIFEASTRNTFSKALIEQVFLPIHNQGYSILSNPVGRLIIRTHEKNTYKRYFEIWVPVS